MTPTTITITRTDGRSISLPVTMGCVSADVGGYREDVAVPHMSDDARNAAFAFTGTDVEQHMQYLYVDGGLTSAEFDDYAYALV